MKIEAETLAPIPQETIVREIRETEKFLGSLKPQPGQKVWIVDTKVGTITEAQYETSQVDFNSKEVKKKLILPKGCVPVVALNKKNVLKKLYKAYR